MSKKFKVVHEKDCVQGLWEDQDCPTVEITLHEPPYENENVIQYVKWPITEVKIYEIENLEDIK